MAADEALNALKLTDSENTPKGTDAIGTSADDELRSIKANIARSARWETTATASATTLPRTTLHKLTPITAGDGAATVTLPNAADGSMTGFVTAIMKTDSSANAVTIDTAAETINGASDLTLTKQYDTVVLVSDATNWLIASSNRNTLGAITVEGTASFSATAIFKSAVDISATASIGVLVVAGTTTAVGAVVMKSTLAAEGNVTVSSGARLDVQGEFNAGTATFSATAVFKSKISVSATASVGALTVAGAAYSASLVIQQDSKRTRYTQIIPGVTIPGDDTPPTTSETNPIKFGAVDPDTPTSSASATLMAVTITPSAGNLVSIDGLASFVTSNTSSTPVCLFRDSDTDSIAVSNHNPPGVGFQCSVPIHYEFTATAAVSMSFHLRMGNTSGAAVGVNGDTSGNGVLGGTQGVWLRVQEIAL